MKKHDRKTIKSPWWRGWSISLLAVSLLILSVFGIWFIKEHQKHERQDAENYLWSIAELKAAKITKWRQEREADATVLMKQRYLEAMVADFFRDPVTSTAADIRNHLRPVKYQYHYEDILLVDPQNRVRFSLARERLPRVCESYDRALAGAVAEQKPAWMSFHVGPDYPYPHISVICPFFSSESEQAFIGAVVLVIRADQFLYPLIQSWPVPSRTAESLLVRKYGRDILFLNELRHQRKTALQLKIPVNQSDLPAAMAVSGHQGIVTGRDYRGEKVLAAILPVPHSPWFLVAKIDTAEILAVGRLHSGLLLGCLLAVFGLMTAFGFFLRQRYLKQFYKERYRAETVHNQALIQHHTTLQSIGDAVIVTDGNGRITMINSVAEQLTGWKSEAAVGQMINHVFQIISEITREKVDPPIKQVLDEGVIVGLANHTLLISKDGREIPIADSAAPIRDKDNRITGVVLVFRDQTVERDHEARLSESENKYRLLSDNSLDVIWTMDLDFKFTYVNPAIETLTGFSPEEWIGSSLSEHCEDKSLTTITRVINETTAREPGNSGFIFEDDVLNNRGEPVPVEIHGRVIYDDNGQPVRIQGVTRDISERKKAERLRHYQEHLLREISDIARIGGWEMDTQTREVTWTDGTYAIHEVPRDYKPTLEKAINFYHPEDIPMIKAAIKAALEKGEPYDMELRFITAKGRHLWTQSKCVPIMANETVVKLQGFFHDITDWKIMSEKLADTTHSLQLALKSSNIGMFDWNMDTGEVFYSPEWKNHIGFTDDEIEPRYEEWETRVHADDRERVMSVLNDYLENKDKEYKVQFRMLHKDGTYRHILARGEALRDKNGRPFRMTGCHLDISEQKQAEKEKNELENKYFQAQKMDSIGRLAGGVAHDLNNMLTPIIGNTELLLTDLALDEDATETMQDIFEAAERARNMVTQLLAFSRRQTLEVKTVNINQTVRRTAKLLRKTIREDIRINYSLADDLHVIKADEGQFEQVFMNLIINAQHAMPNGGKIQIETGNVFLDEAYISSRMNITPGPYVQLAISDTGVGMDEETKKNLFEPFYTTKDIGKGTGLGLATTYGIVKQHQGDIWVYSEPDKGSTFKLYFPAAPGKEISDSAPKPREKDLRGAETIIVVEDDEKVRKITVKILKSKGYTTLSMASGQECLDFLKSYPGPIDLLLADVIMLEMNGRELYEKVAAIYPEVKVLYMSGYNDNVISHHGILDGKIDFIQKPFTVYDLSAKVREVLDKK